MLNGKKIVVVMPAYNAEKTLKKTYNDIYHEIVDEIILTDDKSSDNTKDLALDLNITTIVHKENRGYGGNQKSCYTAALKSNADIVIMLHPDYQYTPKLIPAIASMLAFEEYDAVIASRMLSNALEGGMPLYKYIANKFLTAFENLLLGQHLSEYHTGFRGFKRKVLETLPLESCDDDFVFDKSGSDIKYMKKAKIIKDKNFSSKYHIISDEPSLFDDSDDSKENNAEEEKEVQEELKEALKNFSDKTGIKVEVC